MGASCTTGELQEQHSRRISEQAAAEQSSGPPLLLVICDSHSGAKIDIELPPTALVSHLQRLAAPKLKVAPRLAGRLELVFAGVLLRPEAEVGSQEYGMCDGAEVVAANTSTLIGHSPVPLYRRLKENEKHGLVPLDYAQLTVVNDVKVSNENQDNNNWLTGLTFLDQGMFIACVRNGTQRTLTLVDTKPAEWNVTKIMFDGEAVKIPDSCCLLGDGVLAVTAYEPAVGPRLYDWVNDDWQTRPQLKLHARPESPYRYGKMCGLCEDSTGRLIAADIMKHRVVIFDRKLEPASARLPETLVEVLTIGNLHHPCGLAILPDDSFGVTEWAKNRVSVFGPNGTARYAFESHCDNPRAMAVDLNGCIMVSDYDNPALKIFNRFTDDFDANGLLVQAPEPYTASLSSLSHSGVKNPMAVAINPDDGHLFVASSADGRVVELGGPSAPAL